MEDLGYRQSRLLDGDVHPLYNDARRYLRKAYIASPNFEKEIESWKLLVEKHQYDTRLRWYLQDAYVRAGILAMAYETMEAVREGLHTTEWQDSRPMPRSWLEKISKHSECDIAIGLLKDEIAKYSLDIPRALAIARAFYRKGNEHEAIEYWKATIERNPNSEIARVQLEEILSKSNDYEDVKCDLGGRNGKAKERVPMPLESGDID